MLQGTKWIAQWWFRWITIKQNNSKTKEETWTKVPCYQTTQDPTWLWTWLKTVVTFKLRWISCQETMEVGSYLIHKIITWVTVALNIWSRICTCRFRVQPNKRLIIFNRKCKGRCMIKIKVRLSNRIIQLWQWKILLTVIKRVLLCCHMHQELNLNPKLLGLLKLRSNKRIKNVTCQCSNNKTEWLTCLCPVKIKKDRLKNMSTVITLQWITIQTRLKWCKTTLVYFNNHLRSAPKVIDNNNR